MRKNILEYLEESAKRVPDKCAFSDGKDSITFKELLDCSLNIASGLIEKGFYREAVVVFMDKHPSTLTAFFGAVYAGCFYICVDRSMPDERIKTIIQNSGARVLICKDKYVNRAENLGAESVFKYSEICGFPKNEEKLLKIRENQLDTDPIYVVFTSGSTGVPKGVVACHRSVIDYTEALCKALEFNENTVFGNQTPLYFDAPLKEIMPTLKFGATTYFIPKVNFMFPVNLLEYLNKHKINTICWVVSALVQISSLGGFDVCRPEYLTTVAFGSEVFPKKDYRIWRENLPDARFFNLYGPTEATGMSCYWKCERELDENEPIPIGRPFDNTEIMLIDSNGQRVKNGEAGEIYIRGTCVTEGYLNNPEKTKEAFVQNPLNKSYPETVYRTGDIGKYNEHGELVFVCRKDLQIKHMGHRIELLEIESAAVNCKEVASACCTYDKEGKRIALFYTGEATKESIVAELNKFLPRYMIPSVVKKLDRMPFTDNGKINRSLLAAESAKL